MVTPILKKTGLDCNVLGNFRPVSNLPFLSKVLEKIVLKQLQQHLCDNGLMDMYQSAYRKDHSTETAVLSVLDSLQMTSDERCISVLALLDLSAAFDTLDHSILLRRLEISFGLHGTVLLWFKSYVEGRFQCVSIDGVASSPCPLVYGVPQGSVLGPVLFTLYSQPLSGVISSHGCQYHKYADDTELSKSAPPDDFPSAISSVQECVSHVLAWMDSNKLKLNTDKTEVMSVSSRSSLGLVGGSSINLCGADIPFQKSVKYLGVKIDQTLSMHDQISSVCRACFFDLRRISSIRSYLSKDAAMKLISATILSRLDYCNSTLIGVSEGQLERLQRVQNSAARLVLRKKKRDHVTPMLKELHWLPVKARYKYKIAVLAYRHFDGSLAPYLSATLCTRRPSRTLRSSNENRLVVPRRNLRSAGERTFSFAAPVFWNSLPASLRQLSSLNQFKCQLKAHLFQQYL